MLNFIPSLLAVQILLEIYMYHNYLLISVSTHLLVDFWGNKHHVVFFLLVFSRHHRTESGPWYMLRGKKKKEKNSN